MRYVHALVLVLALAGCTRENGLYIGDGGSGDDAGDGGDDAAMCPGCTDGGLDMRPADMPKPGDMAAAMCGPSGSCAFGPACGNICCGAGERCDNGACKCGMNKSCSLGEYCSAGGPTPGPGSSQCGFVCCGGVGNPCPL